MSATTNLHSLVREVSALLSARGLRIAVAESCTGGLIAATCTGEPGSSAWFECGVVAYTAAAKSRLLGVSASTIESFGVVSENTAREMAEGILARCAADRSVSITGIAGPGGGTQASPVGRVWLAWAARRGNTIATVRTAKHDLPGNRTRVRNRCVEIALTGLVTLDAP